MMKYVNRTDAFSVLKLKADAVTVWYIMRNYWINLPGTAFLTDLVLGVGLGLGLGLGRAPSAIYY
jgi:hypothetical protein